MFNDDDDERSARKSSLKGLLKAFKGKGELRALVREYRHCARNCNNVSRC